GERSLFGSRSGPCCWSSPSDKESAFLEPATIRIHINRRAQRFHPGSDADDERLKTAPMNTIKTFMLLAAMTALFMGLGYLIGGAGGATIAFLVAAAMNLFAYWNADKMV